MSLTVAPCTFDAARYATLNWHYSQAMPKGKLVKFGVWEDRRFVGAIIFGRGATPQLVKPYGLQQTEACELVRIAMREHAAPVTQAVAEAIRQLKKTNPGLRLVISFADPAQGHEGKIYQAGNWLYTGRSADAAFFQTPDGRLVHPRAIQARKGSKLGGDIQPTYEKVVRPGKHRYLMPLDRKMRRAVAHLVKPYPRGESVRGDAPGTPPGEAGSIPARRSKDAA